MVEILQVCYFCSVNYSLGRYTLEHLAASIDLWIKEGSLRTTLYSKLKNCLLLFAAARKHHRPVKSEHARVPRSLFDRPTAAILKARRDAKLQRLKPPAAEPSADKPEWLIQEDWALLQVSVRVTADIHCTWFVAVMETWKILEFENVIFHAKVV